MFDRKLHFIFISALLNGYFYAAEKSVFFPDCECGIANTRLSNRILGGTDTSPHEYPWVAGIFDDEDEVYCGGSIISNLHILTAAHCVYYTDPFALHVLLGLHDRIRQNGIRFDFMEIYLHPHFKPLQFHDTSDIAIGRVDRAIVFSQKISPICLPFSNEKQYVDQIATVSGWGRMWSGGKNSRYLKETTVKVQSEQKCRATKIGRLLDADTMICAYARNSDACQGDSGGPLFYKNEFRCYEQIGVISFGIGCGTENTPGIYTKITTFLPWIRRIISTASKCFNRSAIFSSLLNGTNIEYLLN